MPDSNTPVGGHTPGPWHVEHRIHVKAENGYRVATVNVPSGRVGSIEVNPFDNARLIAAAPEMLASLIELCDKLDTIGGEPFVNPADSYWARARAAIAKATEGPR